MGLLSTVAAYDQALEPYVVAVVLALGAAAVCGAAARRGGRISVRGSWPLAVVYAAIAAWQAEHVVEWCVHVPPLAFTAVRMLLWFTIGGALIAHVLWRHAHPEV